MGAAALAVALKTRNKKIKSMALPASLSAFMGITEPAIFGVNVRYGKPFLAGIIGGACGAMVASIMGVYATANGVTGIFGFLITTDSVLGYLLTFIVASAVAFGVSWALYKDEGEPVKEKRAEGPQAASEDKKSAALEINTEKNTIYAPMKGKVIPLSEVPDETFASGALGDGCAIIPEEGVVYAPVDGKVSMVFDTKHAIGLTSKDGAELLIHIGINTVELKGEPFEVLVADGDQIRAGQPLVRFDMDFIAKKGCSLATPVIVTNGDDYAKLTLVKTGDTKVGEKLLCSGGNS